MRCKGRWFHCWHYIGDTLKRDRCKPSNIEYGSEIRYHCYRCCVCKQEKMIRERHLYGGY